MRVSRGAVFDVAVDIRPGSPTYRQWAGVRLSSADWNQLLIPKGFAHGFLALEPDCEVQYKVTAPYSREHDRAIRFDDPEIGIEWPIEREALILSDRPRRAVPRQHRYGLRKQWSASVTGGAGFIGSAVVRLAGKGLRVVNVDKLTYAGNPNFATWLMPPAIASSRATLATSHDAGTDGRGAN